MTYQVQIERGVPLPASRRGGGRKPKYPFERMAVGDSFWSPVTPSALYSCARRAGLEDRSFAVREETRQGVRGARCWRTA